MIDENEKEKTSPISSVGAFLRRSLQRHSQGHLRSSLRRSTLNSDIRRSLRKEPGKPLIPKKNYEICHEFEYEGFKKNIIDKEGR